VLGFYNSADRATLVEWQAATGQDATSAVVDPLFVDPTGTAATVDLHLQPNNPAESGALSIGAVTDDFDGQSRGGPFADVGADAGDFTLSGDVFAPGISYPPLTVGSTASRVLTGWATITDSVGVSSGARLYYKKSTDADVFGVANDSTGNGWKYATTTGSASPYSFTIDYTLLSGGVTPGDTIQYFVVAQDAANNLGSSPAGANASASPPVQNVNAHGTVNSYNIVASLSGTKTVGSGGDYPSLSGAGGLFAALNASALTGNLVVNITSDVVEDGSVGLNSINSNEYPQAFNITIQPGSATMRTISGSSAAGLIRLNGADYVTIDGRFGGTGRYLTFRNASKGFSASTLLFINDASNNIVRSCIVEGNETGARGVIGFLGGVMTGNDDNLINGCQVRDLSTAASVPVCMVSSFGTSAAVANSGNTISDNELFNFSLSGINLNTGTESWTVSGNNIYKVNASIESTPYGIEIACGGTNFITGNFIHDLVTNVSSSIGICFRGNAGTTTISGNRITAFNVTATMQAVVGILADGGTGSTLNLVNNQITLMPTSGGSVGLYGIYDRSFGGVVNAFHNTILIGGIESGTRNSWASYRGDASIHTSRNNIWFNLRTGGTGSYFAAGSEASGGSYTASNNLYAGTGSAPASFMDFSSIRFTATPRTFAEWQVFTGDTNSVAGIAGSTGFTASLFANATSGDLHLGPGGSQLVNTTGISIVGLNTDYDGDPRRALTPSIGSDEAAVTFSEWATRVNLLAENAAPTAIPYHDGIENLIKYAFNLNGGGPDTSVLASGGTAGLPRIVVDSSGAQPVLSVEFLRRKGSSLIYQAQRSGSLNGFVAMTGAEVVTSIGAEWERVTVAEPASLSTGSSLFARVQVTLP
ncbi:MAG: beta strand repeat-containing protein, partial [Luteolibacter sp.]